MAKAKPTATNFWQEYQLPQTEFTPVVAPLEAPATNTDISPVFPDSLDSGKLDVSSIITKRLNAMRKLQENPEDFEAKKLMFNTQKDVGLFLVLKSNYLFLNSFFSRCLPGQLPNLRQDNLQEVRVQRC